jgi:hypothetical protein
LPRPSGKSGSSPCANGLGICSLPGQMLGMPSLVDDAQHKPGCAAAGMAVALEKPAYLAEFPRRETVCIRLAEYPPGADALAVAVNADALVGVAARAGRRGVRPSVRCFEPIPLGAARNRPVGYPGATPARRTDQSCLSLLAFLPASRCSGTRLSDRWFDGPRGNGAITRSSNASYTPRFRSSASSACPRPRRSRNRATPAGSGIFAVPNGAASISGRRDGSALGEPSALRVGQHRFERGSLKLPTRPVRRLG